MKWKLLNEFLLNCPTIGSSSPRQFFGFHLGDKASENNEGRMDILSFSQRRPRKEMDMDLI